MTMIDGMDALDIPRFDIDKVELGKDAELHTEVADDGVRFYYFLLIEPAMDDFLFSRHFIDSGLVAKEHLFCIQQIDDFRK